MDLEQLTKHQIVLLTLLVSFVTSIATGIVTVSLMEQAPEGVTRVVNQIVEHTVEKVVPSTQGAAVISTEKTVVVKDDDLAAQSIAQVRKGIVRVVAKGSDDLVARGVITNADGAALTDKAALQQAKSDTFEAILPSGERVALEVVANGTSSPFATLKLALGTTTAVTPISFADIHKLSLGQSVIRIGGVGSDTVGTGVVASLPDAQPGEFTKVEASVSSVTPGSVLITLFGEVIGLVISAPSADSTTYISPASPAAAPEATVTVPNS